MTNLKTSYGEERAEGERGRGVISLHEAWVKKNAAFCQDSSENLEEISSRKRSSQQDLISSYPCGLPCIRNNPTILEKVRLHG